MSVRLPHMSTIPREQVADMEFVLGEWCRSLRGICGRRGLRRNIKIYIWQGESLFSSPRSRGCPRGNTLQSASTFSRENRWTEKIFRPPLLLLLLAKKNWWISKLIDLLIMKMSSSKKSITTSFRYIPYVWDFFCFGCYFYAVIILLFFPICPLLNKPIFSMHRTHPHIGIELMQQSAKGILAFLSFKRLSPRPHLYCI